MSFANILHLSYWFAPPYPTYHTVRIVWLGLFGVIVLVGLVALVLRTRFVDHTVRVVLSRIATSSITMGLLGLLLFSFRQEGIALFSWRIWMLIWLVGLIIWKIKIIRYWVRRVPQIKAENKTREMRERYLPKAHKK